MLAEYMYEFTSGQLFFVQVPDEINASSDNITVRPFGFEISFRLP